MSASIDALSLNPRQIFGFGDAWMALDPNAKKRRSRRAFTGTLDDAVAAIFGSRG